MPKIRRPLRQPNKHAACLMPHAPCPRCRAANATAAKCDLQPIIVRASEGSSCLSLVSCPFSLSVRAKNKISENLQLSGCSRGSNNNDAAAAASSRRPSTKMFMHFFWSLTVLKVFRILLLLRRRRRCVNCMRTKIDEYARRRRARAMPPQLVMEQGEAGKQGGSCVHPKTTQKCACRETCCIRRQSMQATASRLPYAVASISDASWLAACNLDYDAVG